LFELAAIERLPIAILFDHGQIAQLHALEGRKARAAAFALTPSPD
jgi:hypothetical protein